MITASPVNVFDFFSDAQKVDVLAGTATIDCAPQIQAAMTYAWQNQLELYVPGGTYLLNSISTTFDGKNCALYLNNGFAGSYQYSPFRMRGAGRWVTKFIVKNNVGIDVALCLIFNGESYSLSDIGISCDNAASVYACFQNGGAGPNVVDRCWAGGAIFAAAMDDTESILLTQTATALLPGGMVMLSSRMARPTSTMVMTVRTESRLTRFANRTLLVHTSDIWISH